MTLVKICGLSTEASLDQALKTGADFVGAVSFPRSPRHMEMIAAASLFERARGQAKIVAVTVDANEDLLTEIALVLRPDLIQLHGSETPQQAERTRLLTGAGVIKALAVRTSADLDAASAFEPVVDWLMFDAKPPQGSVLPGGAGLPFDWSLLAERRWRRPWFLAGGLSADNLAQALALTRPPGVDVSTGVESAPGVKDLGRIAAFMKAAKSA